MLLIPLHTRNTTIIYKNSLCSWVAVIVFALILLSVMIPIFLVSMLSPYAGISESRVLYEQPKTRYTYQYLFVGELSDGKPVACSTFAWFNSRTQKWQKNCDTMKFTSTLSDYNSQMDRANLRLEFNSLSTKMKSFDLLLIFEASLRNKCSLSPPAVLIHHLDIPKEGLRNGFVTLKGHMKLTQTSEFNCPFYGRSAKTLFETNILPKNTSSMEMFQLEGIQERIRINPAFFELDITETYYKATEQPGLTIQLQMDVFQVPARYHLNVWERLGQFWLYFASFFGLSFYAMNKAKDFLFGRRILRAWEVIPWKKLY